MFVLHHRYRCSIDVGYKVGVCFACTVCHMLELERQQHNQLKHTWQRANDQFLESQRLLMRDMQRIESVLSSEQLRQVEEMKRRDQVRQLKLSNVRPLYERSRLRPPFLVHVLCDSDSHPDVC